MTIRILAFGITKEICGRQQFQVEAPEYCTTDELRTLLLEQFPALQQLAQWSIAVNTEYITAPVVLQPQDEVALIPPVSGG